MAQNLGNLNHLKDQLYQRKIEAREDLKEAKRATNEAYDAMQAAWAEVSSARSKMNDAYNERQAQLERNDEIWNDYTRERDRLNDEIGRLRDEADDEHRAMCDCFDKASEAYDNHDGASAKQYSEEGHEHKDRRNELNEEVHDLVSQIHSAKDDAIARQSRVDSSAFQLARDQFKQAKSEHSRLHDEFVRCKARRQQAQANYDVAKKAFDDCRDDIDEEARRIVRSKKAEKADFFGTMDDRNIKVVVRGDGTGKIDMYYGGAKPEGDGDGHGHMVVEETGQVTYWREPHKLDTEWLINDKANIPDAKGNIRHRGDHTNI